MGTRVFLIVLDGVGAGALPDAADYGDAGSSTLTNLSRAAGGLSLPAMGSLGLGNICPIEGVPENPSTSGSYGKMLELSKGKDTITGHWEMMGVVNDTPFPTYKNGFPDEIIEEFESLIGRGILGNKAASGTEIIKELGDEHVKTGKPIIYTSADSVFQIAAHEQVIPLEELYEICRTARKLLVSPHNICRVIARPFIGPPYVRTYHRRDFAIKPPAMTALDYISGRGHNVVSVGKVIDMFSGKGFTGSIKTEGNQDGMSKLTELIRIFKNGLVFCNLVDFDTLYGHRNDTAGFKSALEQFDGWLNAQLPLFGIDDYLIITADHGLDPTTQSTDHSREYVPVLLYNPSIKGRDIGIRRGFYDIGKTLLGIFGIDVPLNGKSLLQD